MYKIVEKAGIKGSEEVTKKIERGDNTHAHIVILVKELVVGIVDKVFDPIEEENSLHLEILRLPEKHITKNPEHATPTMKKWKNIARTVIWTIYIQGDYVSARINVLAHC